MVLFLNFLSGTSYSQSCDPVTPVFIANLTGQPGGTWISPPSTRAGHCCGTTNPDRCIAFVITLDSMANGIRFDIASGAIPPGALYYQVNCGPPVPVGQMICLSGPGPHHLTFCKPGNNTNTFQITSIPYPYVDGTEWVSQACTGQMNAYGLDPATITWTSIPANPVYNSYLSCASGCSSVTVTPDPVNAPPFVDYQVCGYVLGGCIPFYFCDTLRVNFVNDLAVSIMPDNPIICYGGADTLLTANPFGGRAPYTYLWNTGATTASIYAGPGTYSVVIRDAMNCSIAQDTVVVGSFTVPIVASAGPDVLICTKDIPFQLNGSVSGATGGTWLLGNGSFSPDRNTLNAFYTPTAAEISSGFVEFDLVTTGNSSCPADTDRVLYAFSPSPVPVISGALEVCEGTQTVYSAPFINGIRYIWAVSGGEIINHGGENFEVLWDSAGSGVITLTMTNRTNCDSTVHIDVTIHPAPQPQISGPSSVCAGTLASYTMDSLGGNYSWTVSGGVITQGANSDTVTVDWGYAVSGTVSVTEVNSFGCSASATIPVQFLSVPVPLMVAPAEVCVNSSSVLAVPAVSGESYTWTLSGGIITGSATQNSVLVDWPATGTAYGSLHAVNAYGCDTTVQFTVLIHDRPTIQLSGPSSTCVPAVETYTVSSAGIASTQWAVSGGTIIGSSTTNTVQVQWNQPGTGVLSVQQYNFAGCDAVNSVQVNLYGTPQPQISGPVYFCESQDGTFTTAVIPGNQYSWSVSGGVIQQNEGDSTVYISWNNPGNATISLIETSAQGCIAGVQHQVTIEARPQLKIQGEPDVCEESVSVYSVDYVPGHQYFWNVNGGAIVGFAIDNSIEVQWYTAGIGTVSCRQVSPARCDTMDMTTVRIHPKPLPVISGPPAACENQALTYAVQAQPGYSYSWSVSGGMIISNPQATSVTVNWYQAGPVTIELTEISNLGCVNQTSFAAQVSPRPIPVILGSPISCLDQQTVHYSTTASSDVAYQWSIVGGVIVSGNGTPGIQVRWSQPGIHQITLSVTNLRTGCDSTQQFAVLVDSMPRPVIAARSLSGCAPVNFSFYGNSNLASYQYSWTFGDGSTASTANPSHLYQRPGTYPARVYMSNLAGCADSALAQVIVHPGPEADFSTQVSTEIYYVGMSTLTLNNTSSGAIGYLWDFGNDDVSTLFEPNYQYTEPGSYLIRLVVSNQFGCWDTITKKLDVRLPEDLYVPNAFSPNGDSKNDWFSVGYNNIVDLNINIFDRWGELIYTGKGPDFKWDGTYKGSPVQDGVYVYLIQARGFHGKEYNLQGKVTVLK